MRLQALAALLQGKPSCASNLGDTTSATTCSWRAKKPSCKTCKAGPSTPAGCRARKEHKGKGSVYVRGKSTACMLGCRWLASFRVSEQQLTMGAGSTWPLS